MFEMLKMKYEKKYLRADQLVRYVTLGLITQTQYDEIVGVEM